MSDFYTYCFDQTAETKRFYTNLTDDDVKYLEAAARRDYETCTGLIDKYFRLRMPNTAVKHEVYRREARCRMAWRGNLLLRKQR